MNIAINFLCKIWKTVNNLAFVLVCLVGFGMLFPINPFMTIIPNEADFALHEARMIECGIYVLTAILTIFFCISQKHRWGKNVLYVLWVLYFIGVIKFLDNVPSVSQAKVIYSTSANGEQYEK
ncbi:MAG: hypothetical protein J6Y53_03065 [Alphaproteobacteria bacterium]|nr:hypothetical protein [Alphaproteobacteria bacterium]